VAELEDTMAKRQKHSIAELSRPNRAELERAREKRKETQKKGRPQFLKARDAVYHNWFSPFLWSQIVSAGKESSWQMGASDIRNRLQRKDPVVFAGISRTTINSWIDRSGSRARWSDTALSLAEKGNHQRHPNGGCRGVLVSTLTPPSGSDH
jgi:hypothetical protein